MAHALAGHPKPNASRFTFGKQATIPLTENTIDSVVCWIELRFRLLGFGALQPIYVIHFFFG